MPKFGEAEMTPGTTLIVRNDILEKEIKSAPDHLRCKCDPSSVKKRKTRHKKIILLPQLSTSMIPTTARFPNRKCSGH